MMNFLACLIGLLWRRLPAATTACAPASCNAARQLGIRPQPSQDVIAYVPLAGWIVVEHVPLWQRGPPGTGTGCASVLGKLLDRDSRAGFQSKRPGRLSSR